ncbi:FGGY-family carbohydrate kinase [Methylovirgula sp. 4M-Z18]|uniref:FGGY-family carbohydrate kinase n=1 Tax=Methylovirgula sp. 4M-Z18 TaxID=2293567 RepID=UPI000E2E6570|nr:sugar kinase [Methylovirgula sp. 4M-Z18]RFB79300.1 sugar kinase [Methylovirgula sp. 4M-Z18]
MTTAVLDIGKTNVKLVVLDAAGATLFERRRPNSVLPGPPYPHFDIEAIWSFVVAALRDAARTAPIDTIVTTTHGASGALVNEAGLVLPVLDYEYPAPFEENFGYAAVRAPFAETLSPVSPGGLNLGRQIYWQSRKFPGDFARTKWILTYPQYWSWRLSGIAAAEVTSLGAHTDLWRPLARDYSSLVDRESWRALFPPLRPAYAVLGPVKPEIAQATGLSPQCQIICGIHDSNASLVPHLVSRAAPFTVISTGTWVIIFGVGAEPEVLDESRDVLANVDVNGKATICARFMGGRDHEMLVPAASAPATMRDVEAIMAAEVFALPSFSGPCGPFPKAQGQVIGALPSMPGAPAALAALYLALMSDACLRMIGAKGDLIVEGALAANHVYAAILAALRPGQSVFVSNDATGTSHGAALLRDWSAAHAAPDVHRIIPAELPGLVAYKAAWDRHI